MTLTAAHKEALSCSYGIAHFACEPAAAKTLKEIFGRAQPDDALNSVANILRYGQETPHGIRIQKRNGQLIFVMKEPQSGLITTWHHTMVTQWTKNTEKNKIEWAGWDYHNTPQRGHMRALLPNRLALAARMDTHEIFSSFNKIGAYAFARARFRLKTPHHWFDVRYEARKNFSKIKDRVPGDVVESAYVHLSNPDPEAIWALADLRHEIDGQPLGLHILRNTFWTGAFNRADPVQINGVRDYTGPAVFDAAHSYALTA